MPLPDLIEIVPLTTPVRAEITVPGSKSITNRALILAALAHGTVTLTGALWSEDTQIMVACLQQLGFEVKVAIDPNEECNRTITVVGQGGQVPRGGTAEKPLELFVGNAGTAARFLAPFLCLGDGVYRLHGVPRMHERPQAALFSALRELGYQVESEKQNNKLPVQIYGDGPAEEISEAPRIHAPETIAASPSAINLGKDRPLQSSKRSCEVSIAASSQFASALLLSAKFGQWDIKIIGENAEESPYVAMTSKLIAAFPNGGGSFQIEGDASSGSYFVAAERILQPPKVNKIPKPADPELHPKTGVINWPQSDWQIDARFSNFLTVNGLAHVFRGWTEPETPPSIEAMWKALNAANREVSRLHDLGDSIMTAIVMASTNPPGSKCVKFTDLGRLRVQECERVVALRTELTKCGANVIEEGNTLTVHPSVLHGAEIETYHDHRMAMCFAILGLKVPGIKIKNPACVKKTFPNFFQKLAALPPHGLGVTILDARTGAKLALEDLFAD